MLQNVGADVHGAGAQAVFGEDQIVLDPDFLV